MPRPDVILFDVFGTLVSYEAQLTQIRYESTVSLLTSWGSTLDHDEFVDVWDSVSRVLEDASAASHVEHSMAEVATSFADVSGLDLSGDRSGRLCAQFLEEWCVPVVEVPGAVDMVDRLSSTYRLGVVSNTHDASMVPSLMGSMGIAHLFECTILSVDHGFRKPHESIYLAAADRLGVRPEQVAFVGDSYEPDYLGPTQVGMTAFLIDPDRRHDVPEASRLDSVVDLEQRLVRLRDA